MDPQGRERAGLVGSHKLPVALILLGAAVLVVVGWKIYWFLTDDAYIAFRYVSNRHLGYGYVWNPPPFLPVEGYTSLLWVVLLDAVWTLLGVEPPDSAAFLSLLLSLASLAVAARMVVLLLEGSGGRGGWLPMLALAMLAVATNRTFLMWTSSGLETALFNLTVHLWLLAAMRLGRAPPRGLGWMVCAASASALARPDGLLLVAATVVAAAVIRRGERPVGRARRGALLLRLTPILVVVAHVLWRRLTYGEWLPNTYFAKHVAAWPESGARYLASFLLEYGLWLWLALVGAALVRCAFPWRGWPRETGTAVLAVAVLTLCAHLAYYTLIIGGDHFEYRVYSHLIPLLPVAFIWAILRLGLGPRTGAALLALSIAAGSWIPWGHWLRSRERTSRAETHMMELPVAEMTLRSLRWYAASFDELQAWLIRRHVGMRHQEHRVFWQTQLEVLPSREEGARRFEGEENPVIVGISVGVLSWVHPRCAILDAYGLNDWVIARSPVAPGQERRMAHDRRAPSGYFQSFLPNLYVFADGQTREMVRETPLTDEAIRQVEERYRASPARGVGR